MGSVRAPARRGIARKNIQKFLAFFVSFVAGCRVFYVLLLDAGSVHFYPMPLPAYGKAPGAAPLTTCRRIAASHIA